MKSATWTVKWLSMFGGRYHKLVSMEAGMFAYGDGCAQYWAAWRGHLLCLHEVDDGLQHLSGGVVVD